MSEAKRIISVEFSDGHEVYRTLHHGAFTESQLAAINYICDHAGEEPIPPLIPADPLTLNDADWVALGRRVSGRGMVAVDGMVLVDGSIRVVGGQRVLSGYDPDGDWAPSRVAPRPLSPEAFEPGPSVADEAKRRMARESGFTGDMCTSCGSFSMKRNGSCLCCADCGSTTGCS